MMTKLMTILKGFLTKSVLYVIAVIAFMQLYVINPLQRQNTALLSRVQNDAELIFFLAKKDTYKIQNKVDVKKAKDGSNIHLIPENSITTVTDRTDTIVIREKKENRTWAGRQLKKIGDLFK